MDLIKGLLALVFKLFVVLFALTAVAAVVLAFILKKDVDEIREFTENIKHDLYRGRQ
ncbi:hypothetical protein BN1048_02206 [Jeotgalicoccus saudimassiliensis]|uniref:Uncharacterized protein n=1 Tax=Jeotgalicoccus saudimassiliensis TaxID=1461582 RepID=A0A078MGJ9_9STAP|nr:hypothetical protein [Jeotgalicoccus saudimassiliensis]CEA03776.1 hypothetical protein BN1048_02206 [Jeotgalicoccus saudimassiliensis]